MIVALVALLFGCQTTQVAEPKTDEPAVAPATYGEIEGKYFRAIVVCDSIEGISAVAAGLTEEGPWDQNAKSYFEQKHCVAGPGTTIGRVWDVLGTIQTFDGSEAYVVEWESRVTHEGAGIYGIVWMDVRVDNPASLDKWNKPYEEPGQPV